MDNSSILKDMGSYKNTLLSYFINSEDICELMFNRKIKALKAVFLLSSVKDPVTGSNPVIGFIERQKSYILISAFFIFHKLCIKFHYILYFFALSIDILHKLYKIVDMFIFSKQKVHFYHCHINDKLLINY